MSIRWTECSFKTLTVNNKEWERIVNYDLDVLESLLLTISVVHSVITLNHCQMYYNTYKSSVKLECMCTRFLMMMSHHLACITKKTCIEAELWVTAWCTEEVCTHHCYEHVLPAEGEWVMLYDTYIHYSVKQVFLFC